MNNKISKFEEWFDIFSQDDNDSYLYHSECRSSWGACKQEILKMLKECYQEDAESLEITDRIKKEL